MIKGFIILTYVAVLISSAKATCVERSFDLSNSPQKTVSATTSSECQAFCREDSDCRFFVFKKSGDCEFFSVDDISSKIISDVDNFFGPDVCLTRTDESCFASNTDYTADSTKSLFLDSATDCRLACWVDDACSFFVYNIETKACDFKETLDSVQVFKVGSIAGPEQCLAGGDSANAFYLTTPLTLMILILSGFALLYGLKNIFGIDIFKIKFF